MYAFALGCYLLLYCTAFLFSGITTATSRGTDAMGGRAWRALGWSSFAESWKAQVIAQQNAITLIRFQFIIATIRNTKHA